MKTTLVFLGSLSLAAAVLVLLGAKSAVHEILAGVAFLAFAVFASAGSLIGALEREGKKQREILEDIARNTRPPGGGTKESSVKYTIHGLNE